MRRSRKSKLIVGFCFVLMLLAINATVSHFNTQNLLDHNRSVTQSYQVLSELESIVSMVKDVEIGTRGFVITGDDIFLQPYYAGIKRTEGHLQPLNILVSDNTAQKARVAVLESHIRSELANSKKVIEYDANLVLALRLSLLLKAMASEKCMRLEQQSQI